MLIHSYDVESGHLTVHVVMLSPDISLSCCKQGVRRKAAGLLSHEADFRRKHSCAVESCHLTVHVVSRARGEEAQIHFQGRQPCCPGGNDQVYEASSDCRYGCFKVCYTSLWYTGLSRAISVHHFTLDIELSRFPSSFSLFFGFHPESSHYHGHHLPYIHRINYFRHRKHKHYSLL